jgi:Zn-dependent protease
MQHYPRDFGRKLPQRGAAALPVGVLLLFIAALVLIAVSSTTLSPLCRVLILMYYSGLLLAPL